MARLRLKPGDRPMKSCATPGCPEIVPRGRCARHSRSYDATRRPDAATRGYDSRWQKVARAVRAQSPLCVRCQRQGRIVPAAVADHIIPIEQGGAVLDPSNLQALCTRCNVVKGYEDRKRC